MKSLCSQDMKISISQIDFNTRVGVIQALSIFQDNMCEYYKRFNCDGMYLIPRCHAFWVLLKTKIKFHKQVNWLDKCNIETDICKLTNIRMDLSSALYDEDGNLAISCLQELCGMDSDTRKLRTIDSVSLFPKDIEVVSPFCDIKFEKMDFKLEDGDLCEKLKIGVGNIDFFGHTNNVEYAKLLYSTCSYEFLKSTTPIDFEIVYIKESSLGDELKIYKKDIGKTVFFEIRKGDVVITKAKLNYEYIDNNNIDTGKI